ncbi:MAG: isoprenylcysteine carboxylmethyltransferase family protein [Actinobacteria bacterium]|nr:MAG: isoprenylcysteine carboxylmethyltransferase family protein [Actinomycetota bacterium]
MSSDRHARWWRGERGEWYVIAQGLLFAVIAFAPRNLSDAPAWPEPLHTAARVLGVALMLIGLPFALTGLRALGPALTALPYPTDDGKLVRTGPYSVVRHPIYFGLIAGATGWALYLNGTLTLLYAAALFALFDLKSRREERWLAEKYADYGEYCRHVKRLIPWIY